MDKTDKKNIKNTDNDKQKYYLTNFHGDLIEQNLTYKQAEEYCKKYTKEKLYIQKELCFE